VLRYQSIDRERFARHVALLSHAGYETITLEAFVRFVRGQDVRLPPRPLLLSFAVVFTQDRSAFAKAGASNPFGRIDVAPDVDAAGLRALLAH